MSSCVDSTRARSPRKSFFSAVPHELQDDHRLKPRDILTIASILRFARSKNWASMSNRTLASMGRCTERTIQLSLARLEAAGWIRRTPSSADIGSSTGRLIYLTWREGATDCAPPVTGIAPPAPSSVAPELEEQERERKTAPMGLDSPGPDGQTKDGPAPPINAIPTTTTASPSAPLPVELLDYQALGWLDRPVSDPLRQIAEKALAGRMAGPAASRGVVQASKDPRSLLGHPGTLAGMLGRHLGGH